ncbi:hypothetical protein AB0N20_22480 [Streptomyces griseoincarnatus]
MSTNELNTAAVEGAAVVTARERHLAVSHWLLQAAVDVHAARAMWEDATSGIALLRCGGILGAVRIPARLVWAAFGTNELGEVDARLSSWFYGGAVFMDLHSALYYALVPGGTYRRWDGAEFPDVACLGADSYLGVPAVHLTEPRGRAYWCVPPGGPGELCDVAEVWQLLHRGRAALTGTAGAR